MPNPFAQSRTFHKIGHVTNTLPLSVFPTPGGYAVITTTGRKSGKRRRRAIRAVRDGNQLFAVALMGPKTDWLANVKAQPALQVRLGTKTFDATAHEVTDPVERDRARAAYHAVAGWYDYLDYVNYTWGWPSRSHLYAAHDRWFDAGPVVAFDLRPNV